MNSIEEETKMCLTRGALADSFGGGWGGAQGVGSVGELALLGDSVETEYVPNTGRVVLAVDPGSPTGWRLESWDDAPPLPGDVTAGGTA